MIADSLSSCFFAFGSLDSSTVLGSVQAPINASDTNVAAMETTLEAQVNEVLTPTTASGVPW